ncbi:MAG: helix-turn-helix transcriptional regulator [Salaquimonas sp.]
MQNQSDKRHVAEIFRDRMERLIDQRGQSLSAFARSVGLDRSALSQFLAPGSTRLPRAETLHAICRTCGVSLDWLLGLIANEEATADKVPLLEVKQLEHGVVDQNQLLSQWHKEALGYKIRYVPSTLPDLLRSDAVNQLEFATYSSDEITAKEASSREQLNYSRRPETDMEVCMPLQRLDLFASGDGIWKNISREVRCEQLNKMASLIDEMYPTFRLFLFDERALHASPYTVFGPKRAALYIGNMYLVINSAEHIKSLTSHFDNLIRNAKIGPDRVAGHIRALIKDV